ncbi:MAG: anti-sigma factor [Candidatus Thiodiazotropha lotti]|nr:anti-sigma factor [Candidatus Thiodiazotropha lotti]
MKQTLKPEQEQLHAYVDDQLDSTTAQSVENYLTEDSEARRQVDEYQQINTLLKQLYDPMLDEPIPPALLQTRQPRRNNWPIVQQMAAALILLAIGLFSGFYLGLNQTLVPLVTEKELDHVVTEAAMAYAVYAPEVHHPVEVAASEQDHLVSWLSKRMGRPIIIPRLESHNMQLLGGRLISSDDGPGALLMYEDGHGQRIILYACHSTENSSAFHYAKQDEVSVFYWVDDAIEYAIAGDMRKDQLRPMAESVYNQLNF